MLAGIECRTNVGLAEQLQGREAASDCHGISALENNGTAEFAWKVLQPRHCAYGRVTGKAATSNTTFHMALQQFIDKWSMIRGWPGGSARSSSYDVNSQH